MEQSLPWDLEDLRHRSDLLLGSRHRLPVLVAAATRPEGDFYAARIASLAGIRRNQAVRILEDLRQAELVEVTGTMIVTGGRPGEELRRREAEAWQSFLDLAGPSRLRQS